MAKKTKTTGLEKTRPPIVTVMGHIDHGKTTLLDKIRQTSVQQKESGGITQHIGAYQVEFKTKEGKEAITFIDTPGHAAFAKMRARGSQVTDLVLLVVAADDGVKTQTKESLDHIKAAGVPFIVVINKIDAPNASVDSVKGQLAEIDLVPEDYGGKTTTVSVSAKTGEGIDELLEMIVLMAKLEDLTADPEGDLEAVVIESCLDCKKGALATVLVKNGTLKVGDDIWLGEEKVRVRAIFNDQKEPIKQAGPSLPVEILGFKTAPAVGTMISCRPYSKKEERKEQEEQKEVIDIFAEKKKEIPLIIKSDVEGTLEAVMVNIPEEIKIIGCGAGDVADSDVFLAQSSGAQIFSFRARVSGKIKKLADDSGVKIKQFEIIYDLLDEIEKQTLKLMDERIDQEILGKAKIVAQLEFDGKKVAGAKVIEGNIVKREKAYLSRDDEVLTEVKIVSLKHHREDIDTASKDQEFGAVFRPQVEFKPGDILVSYRLPKKD